MFKKSKRGTGGNGVKRTIDIIKKFDNNDIYDNSALLLYDKIKNSI